MAAGGSATSVLATGVIGLGAAASSATRSRRERNSSIVKIWSESDSSTTPPNDAQDL